MDVDADVDADVEAEAPDVRTVATGPESLELQPPTVAPADKTVTAANAP
jgi:hypothetical protein